LDAGFFQVQLVNGFDHNAFDWGCMLTVSTVYATLVDSVNF
jgi:hypothetical protein